MIKNSICRRKEITEEKQKRDKNVNAAGEEKIGKVERNRRRKGIRQKPSQERHESKKGNKKKDRGKQAKTKS